MDLSASSGGSRRRAAEMSGGSGTTAMASVSGGRQRPQSTTTTTRFLKTIKWKKEQAIEGIEGKSEKEGKLQWQKPSGARRVKPSSQVGSGGPVIRV
ncbi:hypothetical protein ACLOJK_038762 [Asimina triloba]